MTKGPYATPEESASVIKRLPPEKSKALTYLHQRMDELHCHEQGASAEFVVIKVQEIALDVIEQRDALLWALQSIIDSIDKGHAVILCPLAAAARAAIAKAKGENP